MRRYIKSILECDFVGKGGFCRPPPPYTYKKQQKSCYNPFALIFILKYSFLLGFTIENPYFLIKLDLRVFSFSNKLINIMNRDLREREGSQCKKTRCVHACVRMRVRVRVFAYACLCVCVCECVCVGVCV